MLQRFHDRVGTAGLIVAIVALVAAMGGGAYAASGGLSGKQKKEVEKIAKKYAGKPGTNGTNGTNGAPGANGPAGAKGDKGDQGIQGVQGIQGKPGEEGPEGSPWTAGGTLPAGKTETGAWAFGQAAAAGEQFASISFTLPLEAGKSVEVHYVNSAGHEEEEGVDLGPKTNCLGTFAKPVAPAGMLCIYEQVKVSSFLEFALPQGPAGYVLGFTTSAAGASGRGSWAVTAPTS